MNAPGFPERFNLARYLLEARLAEGRGERTAILTERRAFTYCEIEERAGRLARALTAAGVRRGDRVLWALPDGPDFAAVLFATLKLGAVGAMANPHVPAEEHAYLLAYTGAAALITTQAVAAALADPIRAAAQSALRVCLVSEMNREQPSSRGGLKEETPNPSVSPLLPVNTLPFVSLEAALAAEDASFPAVDTGRDEAALWLFTSGSTGRPKAAVHAHGDFAYHIEHYAKRVLDLGERDIVLSVPRLYFPYATGLNLMFPFAVGAAAVHAPEHPTPQHLFALAARFRPSIFVTVPTMTAKVLALAEAEPTRRRDELSSLRLAVTAGEALPGELHQRWDRAFGAPMLDGIGSAEMFHIYISNRPGDVRPDSLGRLVPGYEARVVRPDGGDAEPGEPGTLWVRGGSMLSGYHDDPERTRAVLRDGWVVSGDVFRRDADGYFLYEGRADDLLKVGGIYVSPVEVEGVLASHAAVAECAVVGFEDEHGLTKPRAFVVPRPGVIADESLWRDLAEHCRRRLARYKLPREFVGCESLPRNDRGKIVRRLLR